MISRAFPTASATGADMTEDRPPDAIGYVISMIYAQYGDSITVAEMARSHSQRRDRGWREPGRPVETGGDSYPSLDHFSCLREHRWWDRQAERAGRREVDDEVDDLLPARLLTRLQTAPRLTLPPALATASTA